MIDFIVVRVIPARSQIRALMSFCLELRGASRGRRVTSAWVHQSSYSIEKPSTSSIFWFKRVFILSRPVPSGIRHPLPVRRVGAVAIQNYTPGKNEQHENEKCARAHPPESLNKTVEGALHKSAQPPLSLSSSSVGVCCASSALVAGLRVAWPHSKTHVSALGNHIQVCNKINNIILLFCSSASSSARGGRCKEFALSEGVFWAERVQLLQWGLRWGIPTLICRFHVFYFRIVTCILQIFTSLL